MKKVKVCVNTPQVFIAPFNKTSTLVQQMDALLTVVYHPGMKLHVQLSYNVQVSFQRLKESLI